MSRIDYSKWDKLEYSSSSSEEEDDEKEKTQKVRTATVHLGNLVLSSSQGTSSSSSPLWNGLVLHHKDVFVSHVIPKLNETDRWIFSRVNRESRAVLAYAGVDVSQLKWAVWQCTSISTLEWMWECVPWEK